MEFHNLGDCFVDNYIKFHKKTMSFLVGKKSTEVKIPAAEDREF